MATEPAGPDLPIRTLAAGRTLILRFVIVGALSLFGAIVFVRELGTPAWAAYSVAYFVTVLVDQTLGSRLLGAIVRSEARPSEHLLRTSVTVVHLLGFAVLVACVAGGLVLSSLTELPDILLLLAAAGVCSYVYATRSVASALLERELRFGLVVGAEVLDQAVFYAISVPWVLTGGGLEGVAFALAVRGLLPAALLLWLVRIPAPGHTARGELRGILRFLVPTLGAAFLAACEVGIPTLALAHHPEELAYFMTGGSIVSYAAVLTFVAQRTSFASLELARRSVRDLTAIVRGAADLNALVLTSMVVPFCALSWWWYPLLFGPSWSAAAEVLIVMCAGFIFGGIVQVVLGALYSVDAAWSALRVHAATAAVFAAVVIALAGPLPHLAAPLGLAIARLFSVLISYATAGQRGLALGPPEAVVVVCAVVAAGWVHVAAAQRDDAVVAIGAAAVGGAVLIAAAIAARPLIRTALAAVRTRPNVVRSGG